jgi:hypothetical protein
MALGPGKYDDLCTYVREQVGITNETGGGVAVIVIGGNKGSGFSVQADFVTQLKMVDALESMIRQMRAGRISNGLA